MTTLALDVEVTWIYLLVVRLFFFFPFKHWESIESSVGNRFLNLVWR